MEARNRKNFVLDMLFYVIYAVIFIPVIAVLVIGMANAEGAATVSATKDGMVHEFVISPGEEFYYTAELIKSDPSPEPGETEIESWAFTLDEDNELPDLPRYYNWVEVEETRVREQDGVTEVLFYIAVPGDLPAGVYEFTAVTANLEPQLGTTILNFEIK